VDGDVPVGVLLVDVSTTGASDLGRLDASRHLQFLPGDANVGSRLHPQVPKKSSGRRKKPRRRRGQLRDRGQRERELLLRCRVTGRLAKSDLEEMRHHRQE